MTDITTGRAAGNVFSRIAARIGRWQQQLSDRVHADGDAFAREVGWCVVPVTGRFGFGGRIYRDPRFDQPRAQATGPDAGHGPGQPITEE